MRWQSIKRGRAGSRQLALTFDDGPDPTWTPRLAALLGRFNIQATFFCIGRRAEKYPELVRSLIAQGHEIGNHSYTHLNLWYRSPGKVRDEIARCQAALSISTGALPVLFRPPFGDRGLQVLLEARRLNLSTILWSLDSKDWNSPPADTVTDRIRRKAQGGDILLFHDGSHDGRFIDRSSTFEAIGALVPWFSGQRYEFVTVSALLAGAGVKR